jgi:L-ascorbate metabolism protein UlaG (beta-lactamase superfamily)
MVRDRAFRILVGGLTLFFDAYLDRLPGLEPVGLSTAEVSEADFVFVSHAHFDHLAGADAIALGTGATIVSSPESAHCLRACGVPEEQLLVVTGGETVHCGPSVRVRVLPALHSCLFAHSDPDSVVPCLGDLDVSAQGRAAAVAALFDLMASAPEPAGPALRALNERCSRHDGGQLAYLLTTAEGSVLVSASAGYWRGIFTGLRPDVALLSLGGRPNADGEPYQGSTAQYMLEQVRLLQAESGLLPSRSALPRCSGRRHRPRGGRAEGNAGGSWLLRARVRHRAPAVLLTDSVPRAGAEARHSLHHHFKLFEIGLWHRGFSEPYQLQFSTNANAAAPTTDARSRCGGD